MCNRAKEWAECVGRKDLCRSSPRYLKKLFVCGEHFETNMFLNDLRNRLQPTAVPTVATRSQSLHVSDVSSTSRKRTGLLLQDLRDDMKRKYSADDEGLAAFGQG